MADQRAAEAKSVQPKRIAAAVSACKRAFRSSAGCFACKGAEKVAFHGWLSKRNRVPILDAHGFASR
ncbi:hypothetical protein ACEQUB_01715 [Ralstonia syzygii]|uniref:hypothetical protein n=1 Tax=Ralstonia syzygii TaxID=28097 RepID=UPI0036F38923